MFSSYVFISCLSTTAFAYVLQSAANPAACSDICSRWFSYTDDSSICNWLGTDSNIFSYGACGQCEISGASGNQAMWAKKWNDEIQGWSTRCPSEQGITISTVSFSDNGTDTVFLAPANSNNVPSATGSIVFVTSVIGAPTNTIVNPPAIPTVAPAGPTTLTTTSLSSGRLVPSTITFSTADAPGLATNTHTTTAGSASTSVSKTSAASRSVALSFSIQGTLFCFVAVSIFRAFVL